MRVLSTLGVCLLCTQPVRALDLQSLWSFRDPALSEQRFRAALASATTDEALILQTQIARSHGLRKDFEQARAVLMPLKPQLATASAEARTRWALEWGRSFASATHSQPSTDDKSQARAAYLDALASARAGGLDGLAIDAIHMLAFVDTAPADQLKWGREALAVVDASTQAEAKRWEGSIRHNIGFALHQLGRYDDALTEFQNALAVREKAGNAGSTRVAHWMIAWTLRALKRGDEALAIQLRLERENAAAGTSDIYVFEELELLYRGQGDSAKAEHYAALRKAMK